MSRYRLASAAKADLQSIWHYTETTWGGRQAEAYVADLKKSFEMLASTPALGRSRDEVRPGFRSFPIREHLIFYRPEESGIAVARILHQRMDVDTHLPGSDE
ncbi:MAG TPA: type II toxin-antitoxin system RelE/ParE family toxin [Acidobacteriota bacterium]|nr:type II toxin-antitoxin system RelE/ParE family toxin [Acidobacteriota bacterium]